MPIVMAFTGLGWVEMQGKTASRLLTRQRILLKMIGSADQGVSLRRLTLLAFLVAHETQSKGGGSFYSFVPHPQGPVSFTLRHEVDKLIQTDILLLQAGGQIACQNPRICSAMSGAGDPEAERIARRHSNTPTSRLASRIAMMYPAYVIPPDSVFAPEAREDALFTKGYEAQPVEEFLRDLLNAGIHLIVDVRRNPVCRRFGFHKKTLAGLAEEVGISYHHFPEVGIPSADRQDLCSSDDYRRLLDRYETDLLRNVQGKVAEIADLTSCTASVLMCAEASATQCHRSRLATAVSERNGLEVVHL